MSAHRKLVRVLCLSSLVLFTIGYALQVPRSRNVKAELRKFNGFAHDSLYFFDSLSVEEVKLGRKYLNALLDTNTCLQKAYDEVCILDARDNVSDASYSLCKANPELWMHTRALDSQQTVSDKVIRARQLVEKSDLVSIGSHLDTTEFCDQIVERHTVCTDRSELDLFMFSSWLQLFQPVRNPPRVLFAEHVLEHFSPTEVQHLAAVAFLSLKPGGVFRIAVPDGYKPSPSYQQYVRAGSTPAGLGHAHIVAYTIDSLVPIFSSLGFEVKMREYFDSKGSFHSEEDAYFHDEQYGKVRRSFRHDGRNKEGVVLPWENPPIGSLLDDLKEGEPLYTSLWFDVIKPLNCPSIWQY